jgi:hypothetical protein
MSFTTRTGISSQTVGTSKSSTTSTIPQLPPLQVGKVMGVVTTKNTPTFEQFEKAGSYDGVGTIYFRNYNNSKNIDPPRDAQDKDKFFNACDIAKPLFPNMFYYPLLGELVYILEGLPSPSAQNNPGANQKYYITTINLWNDVQTNAQTQDAKAPLGKYFTESSNIRKLLNFEGDCIIQGRRGNSIRFGSTSRVVGDLNEWSDIGKEGNPITIISNGHSYNIKKEYYLEQINKDASSIYLTSNQSIPLVTNNIPVNPITSPTSPSSYLKAQVIINSDRVILSTKKDDIMLLAYTNVEIGANNIINLNANTSIHLNIKPPKISTSSIVGPTPLILLGTKSNNTPPDEPVLLGGKTATFLLSLLTALDSFALSLTATSTNSEGSPLAKVQGSAEALQTQLKPLYDKILTLKSNYTFTI